MAHAVPQIAAPLSYFFGGAGRDIARVKSAVDIPVLRKDFIIDERQIAESRALGADAVLLIVAALNEVDRQRKWHDDGEASRIFSYARDKAGDHPVLPCYIVSDALPETIVDVTATMGASLLVLGAPSRQGLASLLRGDVVRRVASILPEEIHLLIYA